MKELFLTLPSGYGDREKLRELAEKLEYPEIQADKGYYLQLLSEYNRLYAERDLAEELASVAEEYERLENITPEAEEEELFLAERERLYEKAVEIRNKLFAQDGQKESVEYRVRAEREEDFFAVKDFFVSLLPHLYQGEGDGKIVKISKDECLAIVEGNRAVEIGLKLIGRHKVRDGEGRAARFFITAIQRFSPPEYPEGQFRVTTFRSDGAGGQNVNKVSSAVRVVHVPTGTTVVCRDERSQLQNKRRALDLIKKKLSESFWESERVRKDDERRMQEKIRGSIDLSPKDKTVFDERLGRYPYPMSPDTAKRYIEELLLHKEG
ncbi:MAG: peptide chain release factor-like protein [Clostridia bacterium]|nr:peptide chain release factor-like protein [Clostridia bacterium]